MKTYRPNITARIQISVADVPEIHAESYETAVAIARDLWDRRMESLSLGSSLTLDDCGKPEIELEEVKPMARPQEFLYTVLLLLPDDERGDCSTEDEWVVYRRLSAPNADEAIERAQRALATDGRDPEDYVPVGCFTGHLDSLHA